MTTPSIDSLAARLNALEHRNRLYRWVIVAMLAVGLGAFIAAPSDLIAGPKDATFGTIKAERVALMKDGKVKILASARGDKPKVSLHGPKGDARMTLHLNEAGAPYVSLNGADKKPRLTLTYSKKDGPRAILYDEKGKAAKVVKL